MKAKLEWLGFLSLTACMVLTFWAILWEKNVRGDLLTLLGLLLSWRVILGSLAFAGGVTFKEELKTWLRRSHKPGAGAARPAA